MLVYLLKSRRYTKKPVEQPKTETKPTIAQTTKGILTMFSEASRRDAIVKSKAASCLFKVGDVCQPYNEQSRDEYGDCEIEKIATTYAMFGKDEKWPEHDEPMIVTAYSPKKQYRFLCTVGFLKLKDTK